MTTSIENSATMVKTMALGILPTSLMAAFSLAARPAHASTTFKVKHTNDAGAGSLRRAMFDANVTAGADVIEFNIPGAGVHTIAPTSALPKITDPVTINGYSQPGAKANTRAVGSDAVLNMELSGAGAPPGIDGLWVAAPNSVVRGLVINRWDAPDSIENAIYISGSGATGNRVAGNYTGIDATGTKDLGNAGVGVFLSDAPDNTIGARPLRHATSSPAIPMALASAVPPPTARSRATT